MTYRGGQRSASQAAAPKNPFQFIMNLIGRPAAATDQRKLVPISSDQLPPGAFMRETGDVVGMSSEQVPKGGYMTETGRVYVPEGFKGFERQGPAVPSRIQNAPSAPILPPPVTGPTPIIRGTRDGVTPDRTQSDEYRAQMAQYGALQKAKKFEEAEALGQQIWQQKYGKTAMAQPGGAVGTYNPLMEGMPGRPAATIVPGQDMTTPGFSTESSFSIGANSVPAPWSTQGAAVSAPYQQAMQQAAEKTTGEGMPDFSTTIGDQVQKALGRPEYARFLQK